MPRIYLSSRYKYVYGFFFTERNKIVYYTNICKKQSLPYETEREAAIAVDKKFKISSILFFSKN